MLFKNKRLLNLKQCLPSSIVKRITLWYSIFICLLFLCLFIVVFLVSGSLSDTLGKEKLQRSAQEISQKIKLYESYDDGIYFSIYNQKGEILHSAFPKGFDQTLAFTDGKIKTYTVGNDSFEYYDIVIANSHHWLRAVRVSSSISEEYLAFLILLVLLAPLAIAFIILGGYFILKRSFIPITEISKTAQFITNNHDFSKRVNIHNSSDELIELVETINQMLAATEASLVREKQFNHDVSHELRTPLTVILSETEYIQNYVNSLEEALASNEVINRQAKRMKSMVEQILELSRLENTNEVVFHSVAFSEIIHQKIKDSQRLFSDRKIRLNIQIQDELYILGNELLLDRLLDNLLSNALKFAKEEVIITLFKKDSNCQLIVSDDGSGIPKEHQDKIWQKFYQIDAARNKSINQGVGLGLSLVKEIVVLHHGQLDLVSELAMGSRFIISLPCI